MDDNRKIYAAECYRIATNHCYSRDFIYGDHLLAIVGTAGVAALNHEGYLKPLSDCYGRRVYTLVDKEVSDGR